MHSRKFHYALYFLMQCFHYNVFSGTSAKSSHEQ